MCSKCGTKHGFKGISITLPITYRNTLENNCPEWLKNSMVVKECCVPTSLEPYHGVISTQDLQKAVAVQPRVQAQTRQTQSILKTNLH